MSRVNPQVRICERILQRFYRSKSVQTEMRFLPRPALLGFNRRIQHGPGTISTSIFETLFASQRTMGGKNVTRKKSDGISAIAFGEWKRTETFRFNVENLRQ